MENRTRTGGNPEGNPTRYCVIHWARCVDRASMIEGDGDLDNAWNEGYRQYDSGVIRG